MEKREYSGSPLYCCMRMDIDWPVSRLTSWTFLPLCGLSYALSFIRDSSTDRQGQRCRQNRLSHLRIRELSSARNHLFSYNLLLLALRTVGNIIEGVKLNLKLIFLKKLKAALIISPVFFSLHPSCRS